ncbi:MAG: sulfite exporter TauE/SafE family protein [Mariniphaga sp.]|nr:sulfite exporter TauE/SafE family protein [Mariniphaga sp.]
MEILLVLLVGCFSGMITGLTGASGVMVVVPLITILFKFPIHEAIGTSLVVDVLTSLMISATYFKNDNITLKAAGWVAISSVTMAQIGARFSDKIPERGLDSGFSFVLVVLALIIWRTGIKRDKVPVAPFDLSDYKSPLWRLILSVLLAGGSGFLTGFIGAGGGTNILLILLFVNKFPMHKALGTSILIMSFTALSGVIGHASFGNVNILTGITLAASAIPAGIYCARFTSRISEKSLSRVMSGVYIILGVVMMFINLRNS